VAYRSNRQTVGQRAHADGEVDVLDTSVRLKDVLGLHYLARLVAEPEREIHALDLAGARDDETRGDAGEVLDADVGVIISRMPGMSPRPNKACSRGRFKVLRLPKSRRARRAI
jgi:hypothetical protein